MARPRFLADEDLRLAIVLAVRRLDSTIDFPTVIELGRAGSPDEAVLDYAHAERRILVSHDINTIRGLAELRVQDGRGVSGVLLAAQGNPTRAVANTIALIAGASEADEWVDRVV